MIFVEDIALDALLGTACFLVWRACRLSKSKDPVSFVGSILSLLTLRRRWEATSGPFCLATYASW